MVETDAARGLADWSYMGVTINPFEAGRFSPGQNDALFPAG
jgi:hypothetical protein